MGAVIVETIVNNVVVEDLTRRVEVGVVGIQGPPGVAEVTQAELDNAIATRETPAGALLQIKNEFEARIAFFVAYYGNDAAAIQEAIDDAAAIGGGLVVLEPEHVQVYLAAAKLTIPSNVHLNCMRGTARVKLADGTNGIFDLVGNVDTVAGNDNITVKNLIADGNRANNPGHKGCAIAFRGGCTNIRLEDIGATGANTTDANEGIGVNIQGGDGIWLTRVRGHDNDRHGIACGATPTNMHWNGCEGFSNGQEGIHTSTGEFVAFTGNIAHDNGIVGIALTNAKWEVCTGNVSYNNPVNYQMLGGHKALGTNYSYNAGQHHIELDATSDSISKVILAGFVCDVSGDHAIYASKVHKLVLADLIVTGVAAGKHGVYVENLSTGGYPSGKLNIHGGYIEGGAGGKSVKVATAGYDEILIDSDIPQGAEIAGNPTKKVIRNSPNYRTESSGTAKVRTGLTFVDVRHGLVETPLASAIKVTPTNNLGAAGKFWVSNITATTFRINVDIDPGVTTAGFAWAASIVTGPRTRLSLPGAAGDYASAPDSAALSIVGDLDLRWNGALSDYTRGAEQTLIAKYNTTGNQRSYALVVSTAGFAKLYWSPDGVAALNAVSTAVIPAADGSEVWVRATIDVDNGAAGRTVTFYTSTDGQAWTQLGDPVTTAGVTSIFDGTALAAIGAISAGASSRAFGDTYYAEIRNGIGGAAVASPDFRQQPTGETVVTDAQGNVWTAQGAAAVA